MVELLLVRTSPHEEYSKLNRILWLAQLHRPNSGMSDDVAGEVRAVDKAPTPRTYTSEALSRDPMPNGADRGSCFFGDFFEQQVGTRHDHFLP